VDVEQPSALLKALAQRYAGPYVCHDAAAIGRVTRALARAAQDSGAALYGVAKALPHPQLLGAVQDAVAGFDVSNLNELRRLQQWGRDAGLLPFQEISLTGPAMHLGAVEPILTCRRLIINIAHEAEGSLLPQLLPLAHSVQLGIRVALPYEGGAGSRFGVAIDRIDQIRSLARHPAFSALHFHAEGDYRGGPDHVAAATALMRLVDALPQRAQLINLGGGLRAQSLRQLWSLFKRIRAVVPAGLALRYEPGTWLTESGGFAIARILHTTEDAAADLTTVVLDLSRESHVRWSHPRLAAWWAPRVRTSKIRLVGPTCSEADDFGTFGADMGAGEHPPGSSSLVMLQGISGYAHAFNTGFNGIPPAKVMVVGNR
jgi:diaminopimelate decarboxylase